LLFGKTFVEAETLIYFVCTCSICIVESFLWRQTSSC